MAQVLEAPVNGNGQVHDFEDSTRPGDDAAQGVNGCRGSLGAALVDVLPILPMIASVATVFAYVGGPTLGAQWLQHWPLSTGLLVTCLVGGLAMCVARNLNTSSELVHPQSYAELHHRADRLHARIQVLTERSAAKPSTAEVMALAEAEVYRASLVRGLSRSGPQWVLGTGYLGLYARLHRAEEALFMVEPTEEVLAAALYDELRVNGSAITNATNLVVRIRAAVGLLSPTAELHLSTPAPSAAAGDTQQHPVAPASADGDAVSTAAAAPAPAVASTAAAAATLVPGSPGAVTEARATLREIRHLVNEYRDERREALVRSRCRLLGTTTVTGLITYVLLAFTVNLDGAVGAAAATRAAAETLEMVQKATAHPEVLTAADETVKTMKIAAENAARAVDESAARISIIAATAIYLVGAAVGLFNRLYLESGDDAAGEDYGLSRSRLVLTPILSGLAAIGGVLIAAMLTNVVDGSAMTPGIGQAVAKPQMTSTRTPGSSPLTPTLGSTAVAAAPAGPSLTTTPEPTARSGSAPDPERGLDPRSPLRQPLKPADVFNLQTHPFAIVLAAIFGLTPGLFLDRLKRASEQPKLDLKSTEAHRLDPAASKA